jgi:hypothetical protein
MIDFDAATEFIHREARLLERHRFAYHFQGASADPVLRTLRAYQNADGGFGHALEPDLRAPQSQPTAVLTALDVLREIGVRDDPMIGGACGFLASIALPDGGVPFALASTLDHPHAPWYQPSEQSSLTQTAANAAHLHALGACHPFLDGATELCWERIAALDLTAGELSPGVAYDLLFSVAFLDAVPDEQRALAALDVLAPGVPRVVPPEPQPGAEVHSPLDLSPWPGSRSRRLFEPATIERHLDALAGGQQDDGGWTFPWPAWNPAGAHEWRGIMTLTALRVLRANGRL